MRDHAPSDTLGLVTIHLPAQRSWQGFFVSPTFRRAGETLLHKAGGVARDPRGAVGVAASLPSAAVAEQPAVGALSALLARLYVMSTGPSTTPTRAMQDAIGAAAYALHAASGERWLLVTGTAERGGGSGFHTTVQSFAAGTLDEAREQIAAEVARAAELGGLARAFEQGVRGVERDRP